MINEVITTMPTSEFLQKLEQAGVEVEAGTSGKLLVRGPLTDGLRGLIKQHKPEILATLRQRQEAAVHHELAGLPLSRDQAKGKVPMFPYPINETLGIGDFDPMDIRYIDDKPVLEPGWWKDIKTGREKRHD